MYPLLLLHHLGCDENGSTSLLFLSQGTHLLLLLLKLVLFTAGRRISSRWSGGDDANRPVSSITTWICPGPSRYLIRYSCLTSWLLALLRLSRLLQRL
jgi:hypothetical protein